MVQKPHYIRHTLKHLGKLSPGKKRSWRREGVVVYELKVSQHHSRKSEISTAFRCPIVVHSLLTSSPDRLEDPGHSAGDPGCQGGCRLPSSTHSFQSTSGHQLLAEAKGRESRDSCRRFLWVRPGTGVHTSVLPHSVAPVMQPLLTAGAAGRHRPVCPGRPGEERPC